MKFCKNLQKVVDISDPEWAPYWTNYKMLKKLIKELPSLVSGDDGMRSSTRNRSGSPATLESSLSSDTHPHGDLVANCGNPLSSSENRPSIDDEAAKNVASGQRRGDLNRSPGEIAFFKLLHAEFKKATFFFEKAQQEFVIREERVREGSKIMEQPNSIMVNEKWSLLAKSIFRLYKDLLLFETFAIMTYCSFSKILKKHDKVTGFNTRAAFMANVVNKANFTSYPKVLEMIKRCEAHYDSVSKRLVQEGKAGLYEDERLFINMVSRLNEQVLGTAENEGAPDRDTSRRSHPKIVTYSTTVIRSKDSSDAVSSLRSLVEEYDVHAPQVLESQTDANRKRSQSDDSLQDNKRAKFAE